MMKKRHKIPLRKCIGCQQLKPKKELIRIVKNSNNEIVLDKEGKIMGRGAYICKNKKCYDAVYKKRSIERAFSKAIDNKVYVELGEEYEESNKSR